MAQKQRGGAKKRVDTFLWKGLDRTGRSRDGEMTGTSVTLVKAELRKMGITPGAVKKKPKPLFGSAGAKSAKITTQDIGVFFRQLATMMSSGVPVVQAFELVGNGSENPAMKALILTIKGDIEGGGTIAEALAKHPKYFDELSCNLINAGEQAGILESMLDKVATYREKTEAIKGKVKKAMTYPIAVLVVALGVTAGLLIFVIPQFQEIFEGFGAELPGLTLMVIQASEIMQAYWWVVLGGIVALVLTIKELNKRSDTFADNFELFVLKIPVVGEILTKSAIARFARTLSTMFAAGTPLVEAMESVAGAVGLRKYKKAVLEMRDGVESGTSITEMMNFVKIFPAMVVQMTNIGEESGALDKMLSKVADFYEEQVDNMVDALSSLMEPVIMVVLGGLVGTIIIAMYLPIFAMGAAV
ncbi:type II secretion system F family protein [Ectothiorhodospiraceae bacterium BW-2]|nr:type II secretion system F family protein [Ectothiorhodospiraceae bacterium BW-2]